MIELQKHTGKLKIENYGIWEFLQDFQQGVNQGYELDDSNEGFPQVFGSLYTCLLKVKEQSPEPVTEKDKTQEQPKIYPGGSPDTPAMTSKPVEPVPPAEEPEVKQEVDQPAKRGPKPKNN